MATIPPPQAWGASWPLPRASPLQCLSYKLCGAHPGCPPCSSSARVHCPLPPPTFLKYFYFMHTDLPQSLAWFSVFTHRSPGRPVTEGLCGKAATFSLDVFFRTLSFLHVHYLPPNWDHPLNLAWPASGSLTPNVCSPETAAQSWRACPSVGELPAVGRGAAGVERRGITRQAVERGLGVAGDPVGSCRISKQRRL